MIKWFHHRKAAQLISCLGKQSDEAIQASQALAKIGEPQWQEFITGEPQDYMKLAKCGDTRVIAALLTALYDRSPIGSEEVVKAFKYLGPSTVSPLIEALKNKNWEVRCTAIEALSAIHDPRAVDPILKMLNDPHEGVRSAAAIALGRLSDPRAVTPLMTAFEADPAIQVSAALALGLLKAKAAVPMLSQALKFSYDKKDERRSAAEALGMIGDSDATVPLFDILSHDDEGTCAYGRFRV